MQNIKLIILNLVVHILNNENSTIEKVNKKNQTNINSLINTYLFLGDKNNNVGCQDAISKVALSREILEVFV